MLRRDDDFKVSLVTEIGKPAFSFGKVEHFPFERREEVVSDREGRGYLAAVFPEGEKQVVDGVFNQVLIRYQVAAVVVEGGVVAFVQNRK